MTKPRHMEIVLTNAPLVYFPGNVVEGILQIDLDEEIKTRGVRVKCRGKAHVRWTDKHDQKRQYYASEDYFETKLNVFGAGPDSENEFVLPAGSHSYPFQFVLPQGLPGSFEAKADCYVRYWLKGTIDIPLGFDHDYKMVFTVGSQLDLNTIPAAINTASNDSSKTVCCLCCESEPIKATLRINKTGFVPGEAIICDAEITEGTGRGANSSKIVLLQTLTYKDHHKNVGHKQKECTSIEHGPIQPGGSDVYREERLIVPPVPPSYLHGCDIISIDYAVQVVVNVVETPFDLKVAVGVIIGTIPLQSVVQQHASNIYPVINQPGSIGAPGDFNMPPPSYQECAFGKVDTADDDDKNAGGNTSYAPAYTYYDWINPVPAPSAPSAPVGVAQ